MLSGNKRKLAKTAKIISQGGESGSVSGSYTKSQGVNCEDICFAMGGGTVRFNLTYTATYFPFTDFDTGNKYYMYHWEAKGIFEYFDTFKDPMDVLNLIEKDFEVVGGTPYNYGHKWASVSGISQYNRIVRRPE